MKVFKFGGASVKDADSVKNIARILRGFSDDIVIVISAMGKTTNAMEEIVESYFYKKGDASQRFDKVKNYHNQIIHDLFNGESPRVLLLLKTLYDQLDEKLKTDPAINYHFEYDQIVSYGELISTTIVSEYLNFCAVYNKWMDIRKYLKTDNSFREAKVNWEVSEKMILENFHHKKENIIITQGFIASNMNNSTTTLGREGSDFSAAILAFILNAEDVTVWKDVPGVLNADPKWFDDTVLIDQLSYYDAIELAFYGMSVIHPRTIQPLKNKNINLYVKSFLNPKKKGTLIGNLKYENLLPCFIFKIDQVFMQIYPKDFSFIAEDNLELIFNVLAQNGLKVNLMQNTAVSFKICVNNDKTRIDKVEQALKAHFNLDLERQLELITIRYFDQSTIERVLVNKQLILEQRSEKNIQMVVRRIN